MLADLPRSSLCIAELLPSVSFKSSGLEAEPKEWRMRRCPPMSMLLWLSKVQTPSTTHTTHAWSDLKHMLEISRIRALKTTYFRIWG